MTDNPSEEEALEGMMGVVEAAMSGVMVHLRPIVEARFRDVLERNESIVHQVPAALDHLVKELFEAVWHPDGTTL